MSHQVHISLTIFSKLPPNHSLPNWVNKPTPSKNMTGQARQKKVGYIVVTRQGELKKGEAPEGPTDSSRLPSALVLNESTTRSVVDQSVRWQE